MTYSSLRKFYNGKKVFITGHTGFKGSWLCLILKSLGADVSGYSLHPRDHEKSFFDFSNDKYCSNNFGDICNYDNLYKVIHDFKPDMIFHLAAQAIVSESYTDPINTIKTNILGSANILEIYRQLPFIKSTIYVTSDKCYKNKEWVWGYRENDELGGNDIYSSSKASAELLFNSYYESFKNDFIENKYPRGLASVRAGNVIGGGDWSKNRLVPDIIRAIYSNQVLKIRNPRSTRPWQHVLNPLFGYLLLMEKIYHSPKIFSGSWNFGPVDDSLYEVKKVVDEFSNFFKFNLVEYDDIVSFEESNMLQLNCDKSKFKLNWKPAWGFSDSLIKTYEWYDFYQKDKQSIRDFSLKQIREYIDL